MSNNPEYTLTDNPFGIMFFGPPGSKKSDDGSIFTIGTKSSCHMSYYKNGAKTEVVRQASHEICGVDMQGKENIAKSITAEHGDIVLNAENGNLKIIAKNIWIESTGSGNQGAFSVAANGAITLATGDSVIISSGKDLCLRGSSGVSIVTDHFITLAGGVRKGSPLSSLVGAVLPGPLADLIKNVQKSCK